MGRVNIRGECRRIRQHGIVFAVALIAASAVGWSAPAAADSKSLVVAIGAEPGSMDPVQTTSMTGGNIMWEVTQTLTTSYNETGTVEPLLATSWTGNADSTSFVFTLRSGINFSDGTPFDAEAVKVNLDRLIDPQVKVPYRAGFSNVKEVKVIDDLNVQVDLINPNNSLPGMMGLYVAGMVSPASITEGGNSYDTIVNPIGTGPYKFDHYERANEVVLTRNEDYWGDKPSYEKIIWKIVPEAASREALLKSGEADIALGLPPSSLAALNADPAMTVYTAPGANNVFMGMNIVGANQELLKDVRVRRALNHAIDREGIIENVLFGLADLPTSPVAAALPNYCEAGHYTYDVDKAKELLKEAGAEGMTIKMISPSGRYMQDLQGAQAVAASLMAIGVNVEGPSTQDFATYIKTVMAPVAEATFDLAYLGLAPPYPEGSHVLTHMLTTSTSPKGLNFSGWSNPDFDKAVTEGRASGDPAEAARLICDAQKILWDEAPWLFLWTERTFVVSSSAVKGIMPLNTGAVYLDKSTKE